MWINAHDSAVQSPFREVKISRALRSNCVRGTRWDAANAEADDLTCTRDSADENCSHGYPNSNQRTVLYLGRAILL